MKSPKGSQNTLGLVPVASTCSVIQSHYGKVAVRAVEARELREKVRKWCHIVEAAFVGQGRLARSIQMYLCQKYKCLKADIGAHFGVGESADWQAERRVTE